MHARDKAYDHSDVFQTWLHFRGLHCYLHGFIVMSVMDLQYMSTCVLQMSFLRTPCNLQECITLDDSLVVSINSAVYDTCQ